MRKVLVAIGTYLLFDLWWSKTGRYWEYNVAENKWYARKNRSTG